MGLYFFAPAVPGNRQIWGICQTSGETDRMTVIVENAEVLEQDIQIIGHLLLCPNNHVFEPLLEVVVEDYSFHVLWCGRCSTGHRIQFSINSEVKRYEDGVEISETVSLFLLLIEASVKEKNKAFLQFLRECSKELRSFLAPPPEQDWLES